MCSLAWLLTFNEIPQNFIQLKEKLSYKNVFTLNNKFCCSRGLARTVGHQAGVYPSILCICKVDLEEVQP